MEKHEELERKYQKLAADMVEFITQRTGDPFVIMPACLKIAAYCYGYIAEKMDEHERQNYFKDIVEFFETHCNEAVKKAEAVRNFVRKLSS